MAKLAYDIILKPVITERKSMEMLTQGANTHFQGCQGLNKIEDS